MKALVVAATVLGATAFPTQRDVESEEIFHFFVFGDSYTSSEFNTSGVQPSLSQPFGNPPVGTSPDDLLSDPQIFAQTTANGPNWPMYLSVIYNTTATFLYDFAISGASIPDGFTVEILNEYEPQYASQFGEGPGQWNSDNSIFASWISINDINWCSSLFSSVPSNFSSCLPPRLDMYFDLMDGLYDTGARNYFFVNMPPLFRAPMVTENGEAIIENYKEGVTLFNEKLFPEYVETFTSTHDGVNTVIYDAFSLFSEILDNPTWYGFKDNSSYTCIGCTNGTGDFWSNNYHPTTDVHERIARDMLVNLTSIGWPPSSS